MLVLSVTMLVISVMAWNYACFSEELEIKRRRNAMAETLSHMPVNDGLGDRNDG
jgi:hypothetical protein